MAQFTLDDIRTAAEAKYGSTDIAIDDTTTVRLVNVLRLPKEKRTELQAIQDAMNPEDEEAEVDHERLLEDALRLVAERDGDRLVKALGGDLALLMEVFSAYTDGTQAGEASASRD